MLEWCLSRRSNSRPLSDLNGAKTSENRGVDMSPIVVCSTPSLLMRAFVVLLLAYLLALLTSRGRGRRHTLASAVIPVVLTPLFLGASATSLMVARVMQMVSMTGGGRASRAAGVAEALVSTVLAAGVAGTACAIAILQELIARKRGKQKDGRRGAQITIQIIAVCIAVATFGWTGVLSWKAASGLLVPREYLVAIVSACASFGAALATCIWLIALRRRDVAFQPSHPIVASLAVMAACGTLGFGTWQVVQHLSAIATGK